MEAPYEVNIDQGIDQVDTDNTDADADSAEPTGRRWLLAGWNGRELAVIVAGTAVLLAAAAAVIWLLYQLITGLAGLIGAGFRDLLAWLAGGPITSTVTDPIHAYLHSHAAGLPVTARQLWTTWLVLTVVLFAAAVSGSPGGRIGWAVLGALTTAMVYAGAPAGGQALAAGLTAAVWALLAVPAFARSRRTYGVTLANPAPSRAPNRAGNTDTDTDTDT